MPKVITSPSSRWPGQVTLSSPMSLPQALAWERANRDVRPIREQLRKSKADGDIELSDITEIHNLMLPAVIACVEKWELKGLGNPPDPYPASPRNDSMALMGWLINAIDDVYSGEEEKADPNE
jgi:hypothetical protein